jgi:radical SAM superfamily enzyme YgiQ (UPF0313 family)
MPARTSPSGSPGPKKVAIVNVGAYVAAYGPRKIAAAARRIVDDVKLYFVPTGTRLHSVRNVLLTSRKDATDYEQEDLRAVAEGLAGADLVGFSCMTIDADWTKRIIAELKKVNPGCYVVWGGVHPIVCPEDAVQHADAVCTSEGDLAFDELLQRMAAGQEWGDVRNFWFNRGGAIVRNGFRPLLTPAEMSRRPHPLYAEPDLELIHERGRGFVPMSRRHYLEFNGLSYHTIWTQGCPYRCTYCGNTAFLAIDKGYAAIRQTPVDYIIEEVRRALERHPHLNTIVFDDDCMAALPVPVLEEFSAKWRERVGVPFFVAGVIPAFVNREKLEILLEGGMNRLRMGIQSGSDRMLKFFKRPNKPGLVLSVARVIADYRRFMIPPAYDMIVDIPVEQKEDVEQTIRLVYDMPRPFTLSMFSLRVIPGTELENQVRRLMEAGELDLEGIDKNYKAVAPTVANALLYLTATVRPPRWLFERLLRYAEPSHEPQRRVPVLLFLCRTALFVKRTLSHLRFMDFSVLPGGPGYLLWRTGFVTFWQRRFVRRFSRADHSVVTRPGEVTMPVPRTLSADGVPAAD